MASKKYPFLKALGGSGTSFEWCINCYRGCEHGCTYCYGRTMMRTQRQNRTSFYYYPIWIHALPRKDIVQKLERDIEQLKKRNLWKQFKKEVRDLFVNSVGDSYMPLELEHRLTRQVAEILMREDLPFTILTKNDNVLIDLDLYKEYPKCRVGFTITTLNEEFRRRFEPYSVPSWRKVTALRTLKRKGVSTYCSIEPIMPCPESDPFEIIRETKDYVDMYDIGKWSPYPMPEVPKYLYKAYSDKYYVDLFEKLLVFLKQEKIHYCIALHSEPFLKEHGFSFVPHQLVMDYC